MMLLFKKNPKNENSNKMVDIAKKILEFNNQQKETELKILNPIQMLQKLPIALVQVKADNNSEILLNEIRRIVLIKRNY